jgi:diguanylate cyclase (GGDEF)-like protein/PAS domain S-box-containing protein
MSKSSSTKGRTRGAQDANKAQSDLATLAIANHALQLELEERVRSEERYRRIVENAAEGIYQTTSEGAFISANSALARILGYGSPEELIEATENIAAQIYTDPARRERFCREMVEKSSVLAFESQVRRRDGATIWVSENAHVVYDQNGNITCFEGSVQDVSMRKAIDFERERLLAEALERADRDPLTGLLNHRAFHRHFDEEADRSQREGKSLVVAVMDLDNFKFFNDAYGHLAGDEVLREVARVLRQSCRSYDTLGRFGGDEFVMLMPGMRPEEAFEFKGRLYARLKDVGFRPEGYDATIPLSLSIGIAVYPDEASTRLEVLDLADSRLRRTKTGGADTDEADRLRSTLTRSMEGFSMLDALVSAVHNKDRYTRRHSEDVMAYSLQIADELGFDEEFRKTVAIAALLHDVGKIGVPDHILRKPGALTAEEFEAVKLHPIMGAAIVAAVPGFEDTLDAIRYHHERWDGAGYPEGLPREETPFIARLMAVADAYSAMTTDRPYRKGMPAEKALSIITQGAGVQWDPNVAEAFLRTRHFSSKRPRTQPLKAA